MASRLNVLLTPARIGGVEIKNRIVMPPMTTRTADDDGYVTDDTIAYYLARAEGGVGLITAEMASPERAGQHRRRELGIHDDRFLPGLTRLVEAIHRGGAKASIQLGHGGGHTRRDICREVHERLVVRLLASSGPDEIGGRGPSLTHLRHRRSNFLHCRLVIRSPRWPWLAAAPGTWHFED